jgi:hypothetical protein
MTKSATTYLNVVLLHSGEPVVLFASQRWDPPGLHLQESGKCIMEKQCVRCLACSRVAFIAQDVSEVK